MAKNQKNEEKTCWACKRVIVGNAKLGLCPDCLNKYGSPAAALGVAGLAVGGKWLLKNGGKVVKTAFNVVKNFKA